MKRAYLHGTILACDPAFAVHPDGVLAVEDRDIVSIGATLPEGFAPDETIDCTGWILMPGLVNAHVHLGEHLFRGWMDEVAFEGLFYSTLFRWEAGLTSDDVYCAARAAAVEAICAGVTTVADMYHHADATARAVSEAGLRGLLGQKILGFALERPPRETASGIDYRYDDAAFRAQLDAAEAFGNAWHGQAAGRIEAALCPHATNTLTAEMLRTVGRRARSLDLPIHMHLAQMASEQETVRERDGLGCVDLIDACGLLDCRFLGAHGIFVDDCELPRLARSSAAIVHNPIANAKDAGLIAPVSAYLRAGVRIALGTDAFCMNVLEAARFAACIHRTTMKDGTVFPAREILHWATLGGAEALGWDERIGSLEVGKAADFIALDASRIESLAVGDVHTRVLYYGSPDVVRLVVVDGRPILRDGRIATVDVSDVRSAFAERQRSAYARKEGR